MLKFYNREKEIALLEEIEQRSQESAQMTFVVGRWPKNRYLAAQLPAYI
jgi:hypothetical protein